MWARARARLVGLRRWVVFVAGVVVATIGFVGLMNAEDHGADLSPWWLVSLVGIAAVLVGFGSPWGARPPDE